MMKIKHFKKGFTLIELLIVIAIIGVLATLLMANFVGVRQRARDAQRKSDIRQIQAALEIYRSDNGSYPLSAASPNPLLCTNANGLSVTSGSSTTYYMKKIPCDPNGSSVSYSYSSAGTTYTLIACLENVSDSQADPIATYNSSGCKTKTPVMPASFTVQNP